MVSAVFWTALTWHFGSDSTGCLLGFEHNSTRSQVSICKTTGHLRSGEISLRRGEVPGQQLLDAVDRVIGDLFEHAAEV